MKVVAFREEYVITQSLFSLCIWCGVQNRTLRFVFHDFVGVCFTRKQVQISRVSNVSPSRDVIKTGGRKNFNAP